MKVARLALPLYKNILATIKNGVLYLQCATIIEPNQPQF